MRSTAIGVLLAVLSSSVVMAQSASPVVMEPVLPGQASGETADEGQVGGSSTVDPTIPGEPPLAGQRSQDRPFQSRRLMNSLNDLDRPLSPEEITAYGQSLREQFPLPSR